MAFDKQLNKTKFRRFRPPIRAYIHKAGLYEAFGPEYPRLGAEDHLMEVLNEHKKRLQKYVFLLAALWGKIKEKDPPKATKMIDFFGFYDIDNWERSNPDIDLFVMKEGIIIPETSICEDTLIVFGREAEFRRKTASLPDYMYNTPELGKLTPRIT